MAGRYGRRLMKDENFDEGDVWDMMEDTENRSMRKPIKLDPSNLSVSLSSVSRPRMIPRSSSSLNEAPSQNKQFSTPLDIPDWSKIYGKSSKKKGNYNFATKSSSSSSWVHGRYDDRDGYYANGDVHPYHYDDGDGDDDGKAGDDGDDGVMPPHEYLARKLSRSQISSFSVYEGVGRTLKGRDLSEVRNAILTKTGFLES